MSCKQKLFKTFYSTKNSIFLTWYYNDIVIYEHGVRIYLRGCKKFFIIMKLNLNGYVIYHHFRYFYLSRTGKDHLHWAYAAPQLPSNQEFVKEGIILHILYLFDIMM